MGVRVRLGTGAGVGVGGGAGRIGTKDANVLDKVDLTLDIVVVVVVVGVAAEMVRGEEGKEEDVGNMVAAA